MKKGTVFLLIILCCFCGIFIFSSIIQDTVQNAVFGVQSDITIIEEDVKADFGITTGAIDDILGNLVGAQLTIITILLPLTFVVAQLIGDYQTPTETAAIVHDPTRKNRVVIILICIIIELILITSNDILQFASTHYAWIVYGIYSLIFLSIGITFYEFWFYLQELKQKMVVKENLASYINHVIENNNAGYYDFNIQPIIDILEKLLTKKNSATLDESLKVLRIRITHECEDCCNRFHDVHLIDPANLHYLNIYSKLKIMSVIASIRNDVPGRIFAEVEFLKNLEDFHEKKNREFDESTSCQKEILPRQEKQKLLLQFSSGFGFKLYRGNTGGAPINPICFDRKRFHDTVVLFFRMHKEFLSIAIKVKFEKGVIIIIENIQFFIEDLDLIKDRLKAEYLTKNERDDFEKEYAEIQARYLEILEFTVLELKKDNSDKEMQNVLIAIAWSKGKLWEHQKKEEMPVHLMKIERSIEESKKYFDNELFTAANGLIHVTAYYGRIILESMNNIEDRENRDKLIEHLNKKLKLLQKEISITGVHNVEKNDESLKIKNEKTVREYSSSIESCLNTLSLNTTTNKRNDNPYQVYKKVKSTIKNYLNSIQDSIGSSYLPYIKLLRIQSDYNYVISEYPSSIQQLEHAKDIVSYQYGPDHLQLAKIQNHLSRVYLETCEIKKALELCNQASIIRISRRCPYLSSELAASLINYSLIYRLKGDTKNALKFLIAVREIRKRKAMKNFEDANNGNSINIDFHQTPEIIDRDVIAADIFNSTINIDRDLSDSKRLIENALTEIIDNGYQDDPLYIGALHQAAIIYCDLAIEKRIDPQKQIDSEKCFKKAEQYVKQAIDLGARTFGENSTDFNSLLITQLNIRFERSNHCDNVDDLIGTMKSNCTFDDQIFDKKNQFKLNNIKARKEIYCGEFSEAFDTLCKNNEELYEIYPEDSPYILASRLNVANTLHCFIKGLQQQKIDIEELNHYTIDLYRYIEKTAEEKQYFHLTQMCRENLKQLSAIIPCNRYFTKSKFSNQDIKELLETDKNQIAGENIKEIKNWYNSLKRYNYKLELLPFSHKFSEHVFFYQMTYF